MVADNVVPLRAKVPESEKITINLGYVDLGQIDLLVQEGFTPTGPISSARRSATSFSGMRMPSKRQPHERAWI
jgi:hypothetical protein